MTMKYLTNVWYCTALSEEVEDKPLRRIICDEPVVLYRTESGKAAALEDRCSHRQAPLSMGRVVGEQIQCMYHGFMFDCSGKCSHIPHQDNTPGAAKVRSYKAVERWGYVWIWWGEPESADESQIPQLPWTEDASRRTVYFRFHVKANHQLMADNLLDVSHTDFLHRQSIGSQTGMKEAQDNSSVELSSRVEGERVHFVRRVRNTRLGPVAARWAGTDEPVDRTNTLMWEAPNTVHSVLEFQNADHHNTVHLEHIMTPETATSTHYFMNWTRDFGIDNVSYPTDTDVRNEQNAVVCGDDIPMVEAQQANIQLFPDSTDVAARQDQFIIHVHRQLAKRYRDNGMEPAVEIVRSGAR
jgi:vanillate monooxygenase